MNEKQCTTHHYACDCREAAHKAEVAALRALVGELVEGMEAIRSKAERRSFIDMGHHCESRKMVQSVKDALCALIQKAKAKGALK